MKKPRGRPSLYSDEIVDEICTRVAEGTPLRQICREPGMPHWTTFYDWLESNEQLSLRFARARRMGFDAIAEEALEIADTPLNGIETEEADGKIVKTRRADMLGHRKLQVETRLKLLAKWDPKRFGDRNSVELTGADGGPLKVDDTSAAARLAAILAAAQARKEQEEAEPDEGSELV